MIEKNTLARPYAKAAFEVANETRDFAGWSAILKTFTDIAEHHSVKRLLRDATLSPEKIYDFFAGVTEGVSKTFNKEAKNFLHLLALRRRLPLLPEITELFEDFREKAENVIRVEFFSAVPLDEAEKKQLEKNLGERFQQSLLIEYQVDSNLIGGYVIKTGDTVLDHSLKGFLDQMKETMRGSHGH